MMKGGLWRFFDFWLLGATLLLVILGITMIRSAVAGNIELTETTPLVERQIIFSLIGLVALIITANIDYRVWSSLNNTLYIGIILVMIALNVIGGALFGSARWFRTTLVFIQPSEFAKIVMILTMSHFFVTHFHQMSEAKWIIRSFLMAMGITVWVILQPNLSTSIVLLVLWFVLLWFSGISVRLLGIYFIGGLAALALLFPILVQFGIIQQYQLARILNFVAPDPNARYGEIFNINQALISIGSGGLFGQGYGQGTQVQLRFLKVRWSDFIFSATAHELGFIGAFLIILLILIVVYRCIVAARISRDIYGTLISYGVATLIAFQAFVNLGVNLNLLPATGLTLPFVSYGGSSILANMIAIGLVESVIMRHNVIEM
jgi:rod shape determining protein RodA